MRVERAVRQSRFWCPECRRPRQTGLVGHTRVCSTLILRCAVPSNRRDLLKRKSQLNPEIDGETTAKVAVRGVVSRIDWYRLAVAVVENSVMPRRDRWCAAMQQIADWLKKLGMSEYAQLFADNSIDDVSILRDLTDQDLKDVGVPLGHRRKILRAIAELGRPEATAAPPAAARAPLSGPAPRSPSPTPVAAPPQTTPRPQEAAGERRYLTVMFCDLVDSTGIAARLDAEEWRDLVNAYLDDASAAVTETGGHVAKRLGDGLMSLFGYPLAHENDAERAARAALSIQRALCCAALPSAARWRPCSSWRRPGLSSDRLGTCARITRPSRWRHSIARRYAT